MPVLLHFACPVTFPVTFIQMATENKTWGADRIVGALKNLGITISDQTVLNILEKNGIPIAPDRKKEKTWEEFIKLHTDQNEARMAKFSWLGQPEGQVQGCTKQLWACDFFLVPVLTLAGIRHFHIFVFIQYCTRQIKIVGVRDNPDGTWMEQMAKNITDQFEPMLPNCRYLVHDRDSLFTIKFENTLIKFGITPIKTPPRSPNLNPFIERFNRSIKHECLNNMIIFGEKNLRKFLKEYAQHYHFERNHQGIENEIIESENETLKLSQTGKGAIAKKERISGLLNYYYRQAA